MKKKHVILGYGAVGGAVKDELVARGLPYKIINRTPIEDENSIVADALDPRELCDATADASHLYITLGLPYSHSVWQTQWPAIIENVIRAAKAAGAKIVFFDNIYMYGPAPLQNPITEDHPQIPPSKKGEIRKAVAAKLLSAHERGEASVVIGRSADFYGPGATNSMLYIRALQNLQSGKKAQFVGNPYTKHSFTYVPDAGRALVQLALDDSTYGHVWHLPTAPARYTSAEILAIMAKQLNAPTQVAVMPRPLRGLLKYFVPILKEVDEMTYQTDSDYVFSSEKFMKKYPNFRITGYDEGIKLTVLR